MASAPQSSLRQAATSANPIKQAAPPNSGLNRMIAEQVAVTPLPPRKPCQSGKSCPITTPNPANKVLSVPEWGNPQHHGSEMTGCRNDAAVAEAAASSTEPATAPQTAAAIATAAMVFSMSPASTTTAQPVPSWAPTFAMPGFPEPTAKALVPVCTLMTTSAVRKQPHR